MTIEDIRGEIRLVKDDIISQAEAVGCKPRIDVHWTAG